MRSCFQKNIKKIHSILLCKCKSGNKKSATRCLPLLINWRQKRDGKIPGQIFSRRKIELHNQHLGREEETLNVVLRISKLSGKNNDFTVLSIGRSNPLET